MGGRRVDTSGFRKSIAAPDGRAAVVECGALPGWSARLDDETGIDIGYRRSGGVDVAGPIAKTRAASHGRPLAARESPMNEWRRATTLGSNRPSTPRSGRLLLAGPGPGPQSLAVAGADGRRIPARRAPDALERRGGLRSSEGRVTAVRPARATCPAALCGGCRGLVGAVLGTIGVHAPTPPFKGQIVLLQGSDQ